MKATLNILMNWEFVIGVIHKTQKDLLIKYGTTKYCAKKPIMEKAIEAKARYLHNILSFLIPILVLKYK